MIQKFSWAIPCFVNVLGIYMSTDAHDVVHIRQNAIQHHYPPHDPYNLSL